MKDTYTGYRTKPRISVNKLGEYLVASPARRRSIIIGQKKPQDVVVARYMPAIREIQKFFQDDLPDKLAMNEVISSLRKKSSKSSWTEQDNQLSAEALENFLLISDEIDLRDWTVSAVRSGESQLLLCEKVELSVRPELLLSALSKQSTSRGAVKLYINKTRPMTRDAGEFVATVLHQFVCDAQVPYGPQKPDGCLVVDVFGQAVYRAPKSFKKRRKEIEAACQEIFRAWNEV